MSEQQLTAQASKTVVNCESQVDIGIVVELHEYLKQALSEGQALEIDASQVERIDTSVLQLFHAYIREAGRQGLAVSWSGASEAVHAAARLLGLQQALRLPEVV